MAKRYEHMADEPQYLSYEDPKGRSHKNQYSYFSASTLGSQREEDYLKQMSEEGWELCGAPVSPNLGHSYIYYWKRPVG